LSRRGQRRVRVAGAWIKRAAREPVHLQRGLHRGEVAREQDAGVDAEALLHRHRTAKRFGISLAAHEHHAATDEARVTAHLLGKIGPGHDAVARRGSVAAGSDCSYNWPRIIGGGLAMRALRLISFVVVAALMPAPAAARVQEPVVSFDQLNTRLKVGDRIRVVDADGKRTKGILEAIATDSLTLRQGNREPLRFPATRVREVHTYVADSLKNGIIIGAVLGFGAGMALIANAIRHGGDPEPGPAFFGGLAVAGGLAGGTIDHQRVRAGTVLYRAPSVRPSSRFSVAPLVTRTKKGALVSFSF
jgi:hypothetical protein